MPTYTYRAKDRKGAPISGTLDAESRSAVSVRLQAMGYYPVDIQGGEAPRMGALAALGQARGRRIRTTDMTEFYRQMSDLVSAGVPLVKGLGIVKSQTPNPSMQAVVAQVSTDVQGGDTFASALEKHPRVFNKLAVALVRAGEAGGLLDETLARLADFAEGADELRGKIKSALAYPVIMACVGAVAVIVLLTFVMPKIIGIFTELNQTLPLITQLLIQIYRLLGEYGLFMLVGLVVAGVSLRRYVKTSRGAHHFHGFLLRVPKLGELVLKREVAAFTRTLGSLLRNGVPILNALSISAEVMTILPIRDEIEKIPEGITQGAGMAPTLRACPLFPPVVVDMVAIGEETGHLPEVLLRVAGSYESQVERSVKILTSFIEPVIILVLGLVVGFIVIAMLLPIFSIDPTSGM